MLVVNVGQHRSFVVLDEIDVVSAAVTYDTAGDEGPRPLGQKDHFKLFRTIPMMRPAAVCKTFSKLFLSHTIKSNIHKLFS